MITIAESKSQPEVNDSWTDSDFPPKFLLAIYEIQIIQKDS
jgi:hypothetical protein